MQSLGIRRIRSTSANPRRSTSTAGARENNTDGNDCGIGGRVVGTLSEVVGRWRPQVYDVDDITGLEHHRRFSALETELRRWRETAAAAAKDVYNREQELRRSRHEHARTRQQLESVIRDLVEKQKSLLAELEQSRGEMRALVERVAASNEAQRQTESLRREGSEKEEECVGVHLLNLRRELEAATSREAAAVNELSIVVEKLKKADAYIQALSDEAVTYQIEIERLRDQLNTVTGIAEKKEEENQLRLSKEKREVLDPAGNRKMLEEVWAGLAAAALDCADSCDDVSRECDELIDVIKEEQQRAEQQHHDAALCGSSSAAGSGLRKGVWMNGLPDTRTYFQQNKQHQHQQLLSFVSCKPTGAELDQLLRISCLQKETQQEKHDDDNEGVCTAAWEGTARIVTQLLCSMIVALREAKGDVLVAGRAYAEVCRAGRDLAEDVAALRKVNNDERAAVVLLEEQLAQMNEFCCAERERANSLQASLDGTADIMTEAAALAGERTSRMEKLLQDNASLEEALRTLRRSLREREDAVASTERELLSLKNMVQREQAQLHATREELHKATRAVVTAQKELDTARLQNEELERHIKTVKDELQQREVDCLYLRKCMEELRGQVTFLQREKEGLRGAKEAADVEKRRLLLQVDRMRRNEKNFYFAGGTSPGEVPKAEFSFCSSSVPCSPAEKNGVELSDRKEKSENRAEAGPSLVGDGVMGPQRPAQMDASMDKLRWWEEKLQAITSSLLPRESSNNGLKEVVVVRDTDRGCLSNSLTLEALAYGAPPYYRELNHKSDMT